MTTKVEIDDVQMEKLRMDLLDSLDEEIETELEDRDDVPNCVSNKIPSHGNFYFAPWMNA